LYEEGLAAVIERSDILGKHGKASLREGTRGGGLASTRRAAENDGTMVDHHRARVQANHTTKAQRETHHGPHKVAASVRESGTLRRGRGDAITLRTYEKLSTVIMVNEVVSSFKAPDEQPSGGINDTTFFLPPGRRGMERDRDVGISSARGQGTRYHTVRLKRTAVQQELH
jgi:hypothetical protein